ncbi:MAG: hypothetical protein V7638_5340 [Acidobacteriota bacterium]
MPDEQRVANNSQTYIADADTFEFETLEQKNGQATVIRFRLADPRYHAGDVLLVLSGSEIHFHGMIGRLADGWATASDQRGSLLAATFNKLATINSPYVTRRIRHAHSRRHRLHLDLVKAFFHVRRQKR